MAASLLVLLDDIASVLDDVALLTKVAAKKTSGVLGDDLALNAQQVAGVDADRELPVVWAVAKGSFINKTILVPSALAISAFAPWAVTPLLMAGGAFLCYEGAEKIVHRLLHPEGQPVAAETPEVDPTVVEKDKIRGAIRTDLVLSAEIIAITLATVAQATFLTQVLVLSGIALAMTVGVYGFVAGIVKLDDAGLALSQREGEGAAARSARAFGRAILAAAPWLMRALSVLGTAAMFLVGGGILVHGLPVLAHAIEGWAAAHFDAPLAWLATTLAEALTGIVAGVAVLLVTLAWQRWRKPALSPASR